MHQLAQRPAAAHYPRCIRRAPGFHTRPRPSQLAAVAAAEHVDVAIIGGGPSGLATALALQRGAPQLSVRVFEKASVLRPVGFTMSLAVNGQSCLKAIGQDVFEHFESHVFLPPAPAFFRVQMDLPHLDVNPDAELPEPTMSYWPSKVLGSLAAPWWKVQAGLRHFVKPETLSLGQRLQGMEVAADGSSVQLTFDQRQEGGASATHTVQAKVVVGADGVQSTVRALTLKDGPPRSFNSVFYRGANPDEDAIGWPFKDDPRDGIYIFDQRSSVSILTSRAADGKTIVWQVSAPWDASRLAEINGVNMDIGDAPSTSTPAAKLARCIAALEASNVKWPPYILRMIKETAVERTTENSLSYREAEDCQKWGEGPVTLMGDAAHVATPFLAQGASLALEDAVELARSIAKLGPCQDALRQYEAVRLDRATKIQSASVQLGKTRWLEGKSLSDVTWFNEHAWCLAYRAEPLPVAVTAVL